MQMAVKYNGDGTHYWAPQKKACGGWICFKSTPDAPAPPDYTGAANATAAGNLEAARVAAKANRPNEYTPYGSRTWDVGVGGDPDRWVGTTSLTPLGQQRFDQEQRINSQLGTVAEGGLGYVRDSLANPFDWSAVPDAPTGDQTSWNNAFQSIIDRNQPNQDRDRSMLQTQLANQGIMQGSEAYTNAMRDQAMKENDFRLGAQANAGQEQSRMFGLGTQAHQQGIQDQSFARNEPLNMLNAVRTGSQVGMPTFQMYGQQGQTAGPNLLGAAQMQGDFDKNMYNQQVASANSGNSALGSLAGAALTATSMF
jgi:hypothetical protein